MFKDIVGQQAIKTRLIRSVQEGRIAHAQLFHGQEGVGKLALAISYAQYISCTNRTAEDSCGVCLSCRKYQILEHPDLHFAFPVIQSDGKSTKTSDDFLMEFRTLYLNNQYFTLNDWYETIKNGSKQGAIPVAESSSIMRKLAYKTYESDYKIMVIWLPETMHESLANKILKIVEEPYENMVFLLVSNNPDRVINTILSRTQQIKVPPLTKEEIVNGLTERYPEKTETDIENAALISMGSFSNAQNLLFNQETESQFFEHFTTLMRKVWLVGNNRDYQALQTLKMWSEDIASANVGKEQQKQFLSYSQHLIRENFIYNLKQDRLTYMTAYERDFSQKFSPFINEHNVEQLSEEFAKAEREIEQNTNAKMVFFDLVLKTIVLIKLK